jgi:sarcosine oxidase
MDRFDVAVVGLGAMGSAAAYHLAKSGASVVGLDARTPPHAEGSSHGESRIIREAYWEDPAYVPLVRRAFRLWEDLEVAAGQELLHRTGALLAGVPDGDVVPGVRKARDAHGVHVEDLSAAELRRRFPQVRLDVGMEATFEPGAGYLRPEACVQAHLDLSRAAGARLRLGEPMVGLAPDREGWRIRTPRGELTADRVVLATGAWMGRHSRLQLGIERQVLYWYSPRDAAAFGPARMPIFAVETEPGRLFYGFPDLGSGVKVALHHQGEAANPDVARRPPDAVEQHHIEGLMRRHVPGALGTLRATATCMYANTVDQDFAIGADPDRPGILLASPCSGHGFKFASAVGEALAHLATGRKPPVDVEAFDPRRLQAADVRVRPPKGPPDA